MVTPAWIALLYALPVAGQPLGLSHPQECPSCLTLMSRPSEHYLCSDDCLSPPTQNKRFTKTRKFASLPLFEAVAGMWKIPRQYLLNKAVRRETESARPCEMCLGVWHGVLVMPALVRVQSEGGALLVLYQ